MSEKNFSLLRKFTGAEGELPCDPIDGEALSPLEVTLLSNLGYLHEARALPMAWLDGKPVYPDSLVCWKGGRAERADVWWEVSKYIYEFSWPVEAKQQDLGSADKYVKKDAQTPKTYNVVILIDGEVHYKTKALPGDVITTHIKSE